MCDGQAYYFGEIVIFYPGMNGWLIITSNCGLWLHLLHCTLSPAINGRVQCLYLSYIGAEAAQCLYL